MKYNEEIWTDLTYEEKQIYHLYEAFQKRTKKRGQPQIWISQATAKSNYIYERDDKYPGDKIRESKNWKYFKDLFEEYKNDKLFDPETYMDAVFRRVDKQKGIQPAQLNTKKNRDYYKDYRLKLTMSSEVSEERKIMRDIINSYKFISRRLNKKEITTDDLYDFFNKLKENTLISDGVFCCIQEMISPFYFVVSKSFEEAYFNLDKDIQDEIISKQKFQHLRGLVKIKTKIHKFVKKVFKEDII